MVLGLHCYQFTKISKNAPHISLANIESHVHTKTNHQKKERDHMIGLDYYDPFPGVGAGLTSPEAMAM